MRKKAKEIANSLGLTHFRASTGYIQNFCRRYDLRYRQKTHVAQQTNATPKEECKIALEYLRDLNERAQAHLTPMVREKLAANNIELLVIPSI
jgi:hypothetical protein